MKRTFIILGLILLVGLAAMCATPGSNQQSTGTQQQTDTSSQSSTSGTGEVLFNEKYTLNGTYYKSYTMPVTKGSKVKFSYETIDNETFDAYILNSVQHNYLSLYGLSNMKKNNQYLKFYSGTKSEFEYTFPLDGAYFFIIHNGNNFQVQYYSSAIITSGEKLQKYEYVIAQGTNTSFGKDGWRAYASTLQKGEVIHIYYSVRQNEYRNRFIKMYVLDTNGYNGWRKSPIDYSGKIYFDSTNDRERSYEQLKWTVPEKGTYYIVFWNRDSPESLGLDFKIYKQF
ncbi:MAG TPA: hypothetical protein PKH80_03375 [Methanofastidiosum sp.]|nr:hypothetical protein [Methanofastidiosum sp.]HNU62102.1 hypothetical protein [Methanofastidiosum sp.]